MITARRRGRLWVAALAFTALGASAALAAGEGGPTLYTGCLSSTGSLYNVAVGETPLAPCKIPKKTGVEDATVQFGLSSSGAITGIVAGSGLTGGGTSGVVTLGVATNGIASAMLQDEAVTTAKLKDGDVTTSKLADDSVNGDKIAAGVVADGHISSVSGAKVSGSVGNSSMLGGQLPSYYATSSALGTLSADLATSDGQVNDVTDPVHWTKIKGVPGVLVDGDAGAAVGVITASSPFDLWPSSPAVVTADVPVGLSGICLVTVHVDFADGPDASGSSPASPTVGLVYRYGSGGAWNYSGGTVQAAGYGPAGRSTTTVTGVVNAGTTTVTLGALVTPMSDTSWQGDTAVARVSFVCAT
jgi:hypothetical protein